MRLGGQLSRLSWEVGLSVEGSGVGVAQAPSEPHTSPIRAMYGHIPAPLKPQAADHTSPMCRVPPCFTKDVRLRPGFDGICLTLP